MTNQPSDYTLEDGAGLPFIDDGEPDAPPAPRPKRKAPPSPKAAKTAAKDVKKKKKKGGKPPTEAEREERGFVQIHVRLHEDDLALLDGLIGNKSRERTAMIRTLIRRAARAAREAVAEPPTVPASIARSTASEASRVDVVAKATEAADAPEAPPSKKKGSRRLLREEMMRVNQALLDAAEEP